MRSSRERWVPVVLGLGALLSLPASCQSWSVAGHHVLVALALVVLAPRGEGGAVRHALRVGPMLTSGYAATAFVAQHAGQATPALWGWLGGLAAAIVALSVAALTSRGMVRHAPVLATAIALVVATLGGLVARERVDPPVDVAVDARVKGSRGRRVEAWLIRCDHIHGGVVQTAFVGATHDPTALDLCRDIRAAAVDVRAIEAGVMVSPAGASTGLTTSACVLDRSAPRRIRGWRGRFPHSAACSSSWTGALVACVLVFLAQGVEVFLRREEPQRLEAALGALLSAVGALTLGVAYSGIIHRIVAN